VRIHRISAEGSALNAATAERQYLPQDPIYRVRLPTRGRRGRVSDVALIVAVLCVSGDPAVLLPAGKETTYAVLAALLACALLFNRRFGGRAFRAFLPAGALFATLSIFQAYAFDFFPIVTVMGFLTRLFIGMAVVIIVSDFVRAYVLAMVGLASLSFLFWIPEYIGLRAGIRFHDFFRTFASKLGTQPGGHWSLGFHTYLLDPQQMHRNSGIFWEPGAFAGYIIVGLLMLAVLRPSLTRKQHLGALCILTFALLSTFSTTGYVALPVAFLLNFDWKGANRERNTSVALGIFIIAPLIVLSSLYAFSELDILGVKIREQITAVQRHEPGYHINRIGTLVYDWNYVSKRPFTGWGLNNKTRYALTPWAADDAFGNGMADFIVKFGLIGFGIFLLGIARGANHISGKSRGYVLGFVASILILLQGEPFLNFPFFLGLMFMGHASVRGQRKLKVRLVTSGPPMTERCRVWLQPTEL
jgi:O-antigen ligase